MLHVPTVCPPLTRSPDENRELTTKREDKMGKCKEVSPKEETDITLGEVLKAHQKFPIRSNKDSSHDLDSSGNSTPTVSSSDSSDVDVSFVFFICKLILFSFLHFLILLTLPNPAKIGLIVMFTLKQVITMTRFVDILMRRENSEGNSS